VFRMFMHVPLSILKRLAQQSQTALEIMQNAMDNNEDGENDIGESADMDVSAVVYN
jgi:hypothetical protein